MYQNVQIIPNPNNGVFQIKITEKGNYDMTIYSSLGNILIQQKILESNTNIELQGISTGIYILEIKKNRNLVVRTKIIVVD